MAKPNEQHETGAKPPERFAHLTDLWCELSGLAAMISQHWEYGRGAVGQDTDRQARVDEIQEYGKSIAQAMAVIERGDVTCPLVKEAALYVHALDCVYTSAKLAADFCASEEGADFCDAFYGIFLYRAQPLVTEILLLALVVEAAREPALAAGDYIEVDLDRLRLKQGAARALLLSLCEPGAWPDGVRAKDAPIAARQLREALRRKPAATGGPQIAESIKSRGDQILTTRPLRKSGDTP